MLLAVKEEKKTHCEGALIFRDTMGAANSAKNDSGRTSPRAQLASDYEGQPNVDSFSIKPVTISSVLFQKLL